MNRRRAATIALVSLCVFGCSPAETPAPAIAKPAGPFSWRLPPGVPVPEVPADNPMTIPKVELGRRLFYDTRLSGNGTFACSTCHQQARAFTDGRAQAMGSTGGLHARSTMSLANVGYNASLGWADPSLRSLEQQMAVPMFNEHPIELGLKGRESEIVARFAQNADDVAEFRAAFPDDQAPVTLANIVRAIAAFERTLVSAESAFDRYLYRDDRSAMSPAALAGMKLFFSDRLRCAECHATFNLSGPVNYQGAQKVELVFHNTGLYDVDGRGAYPASDRGLFDQTAQPADMGRFRAPTLRNVAVTAPYMHDGSVPTLESVVTHYASGGRKSALRSDRVRGFRLSEAETRELVVFLESLTDQNFLANPALSDPRGPTKTAAERPNLRGALR
jgi:cytochrome c peroxidase